MKIGPVNNTTFEARIKLAKPDTTKLIKGTATALAGTASLYTGLNLLDIVPGDFAKNLYNTANNKHIVETPEGGVYVQNWRSGTLAVTALTNSLPIGSTLLPYGSYNIVKSFTKTTSDNKKLPD